MDHHRHAPLCGRTVACRPGRAQHCPPLSALRRFYDFLIREGLAQDNPALDIPAPKAGRRLPKVLDVDQVGQVLDQAPEDELDVRDLAMFELFYSSGLRLAELVGLDLGRLNMREGEVRSWVRARKSGSCPVGRQARTALAMWLEQRGALAGGGQPAVFVSRLGRRIHPRTVQQRLRRWGCARVPARACILT